MITDTNFLTTIKTEECASPIADSFIWYNIYYTVTDEVNRESNCHKANWEES